MCQNALDEIQFPQKEPRQTEVVKPTRSCVTPKPTTSIPFPTTSVTSWCTTRESSIPVPFKTYPYGYLAPTMTSRDHSHLPNKELEAQPFTFHQHTPPKSSHGRQTRRPPRSIGQASFLQTLKKPLGSRPVHVTFLTFLDFGLCQGTPLITRVQARDGQNTSQIFVYPCSNDI